MNIELPDVLVPGDTLVAHLVGGVYIGSNPFSHVHKNFSVYINPLNSEKWLINYVKT